MSLEARLVIGCMKGVDIESILSLGRYQTQIDKFIAEMRQES